MRNISLSLLLLLASTGSGIAQVNTIAPETSPISPTVGTRDTPPSNVGPSTAPEVVTATTTPLKTPYLAVPEFGYVVYSDTGKPIKAFGPGTPIENVDGKITILGAEMPPGAQVRTEDGAAFWNAYAALWDENVAETSDEYAEAFRKLVSSIDSNATYLKNTLCKHEARPTTITVEVEGGASFVVHAGMKSTVHWNLEAICVSHASQAMP